MRELVRIPLRDGQLSVRALLIEVGVLIFGNLVGDLSSA